MIFMIIHVASQNLPINEWFVVPKIKGLSKDHQSAYSGIEGGTKRRHPRRSLVCLVAPQHGE
jgi:hypothetical protein